jgi:glycosyltransferase involved in cell wall biosynthesis
MGLPISALQHQGTTLEIYLAEGLPVRLDLRTGKAVGLAVGFSGFDVVVVQRPLTEWQVLALRDLRKLGIRTVVEVDDDFTTLHPLSAVFVTTHPALDSGLNRKWLSVACAEADLVTTTTSALARRYAPHGRVVVLPNYVPAAWLEVEAQRDGDVVGWTGTVGTHRDDLPVTRGGVAAAVAECGARFRAIGNPTFVQKQLALREEPENVEWCEWDDYPGEVARLDVGIAPLQDSAFNRAKSWLKPLEYAALGVPTVMSPLPEYRRLYERGIGVLAKDRERDWRREVSRLLSDESYRQELARTSRDAARSLTIEEHAWRWAEAWTTARPARVRRSKTSLPTAAA